MASFNKKHPNVKFEMNTYQYSEAIQKLKKNETDLIFYSTNEMTENYSDVITKDICIIHDVLVVSGELRKRYPNRISILDIDNFKMITKPENSASRAFIDEYFKKSGKMFIPTYELSNHWLIYEYVKLGLGVGLGIKEFMKKDLDNGTISQIETIEEIPERHMACAVQKNNAQLKIIKEFMKEISF